MNDSRMLLHYYSDRKGLYHIVPGEAYHQSPSQTLLLALWSYYIDNCYFLFFPPPTFVGIIEAVAKDFFDSEVDMTVLNQSEENERTGKKEHVVFLVIQRPKQIRKRAEPCDGQVQVQEEDVDEVDIVSSLKHPRRSRGREVP